MQAETPALQKCIVCLIGILGFFCLFDLQLVFMVIFVFYSGFGIVGLKASCVFLYQLLHVR